MEVNTDLSIARKVIFTEPNFFQEAGFAFCISRNGEKARNPIFTSYSKITQVYFSEYHQHLTSVGCVSTGTVTFF